ncbi:hypothetical protein GIX81_09695 [Lactobacillus reuteri]|uniref:Polysaccharide chain length determinant N-terminal domain-containing protein n=1 Tax=Limosilactobacillus reuteri TaxID=1598 RepID=A0A6L5P6W8_LIMRT|nr:Wzz/FepE/Etk N-terminal domain-containing protein [Limosilactobacillus reuteri]MRH09699.1 hypothetical protein [Limosilactobacillus reuteri]
MDNSKKKYSLNDILLILWKNIIIIIILAVAFSSMFGIIAKKKQHVNYTATRNIMITHSLNTRRSNSEINSDLTMIPTYAELIQDRPVINEAYSLLTKNQKMNVTRDDIAEAVKTDTKPQSLIISIKATTDNKDKSILIANTTAAAAKNIIPKIQPGSGNIYLYPKATTKNVNVENHSKVKKYTILGAALGALLGMVIAFVITSWKHLV